jgi:hypothetical protein
MAVHFVGILGVTMTLAVAVHVCWRDYWRDKRWEIRARVQRWWRLRHITVSHATYTTAMASEWTTA